MVKMQYRKTRVQRETSTIGDCFCSTGYRLVSWVRLSVYGLVFIQFSSAAQSCPTLQAHGLLLHARLPCPSPTPGVCSNSYPLSQWCHATISSSVIPFSCLQSFPASGYFPMSLLFTSGGQSIGASALASVLPMNIQGLFPVNIQGCIFFSNN